MVVNHKQFLFEEATSSSLMKNLSQQHHQDGASAEAGKGLVPKVPMTALGLT